jgi:hypothetical protein
MFCRIQHSKGRWVRSVAVEIEEGNIQYIVRGTFKEHVGGDYLFVMSLFSCIWAEGV